MKKATSFSLLIAVLLISGCDTTSDSFGTNYVTLKSLNGWCSPACVTEFTVTPNKTYYTEADYEGNSNRSYSHKTEKSDWNKIEFYLETTGYRNIKTEPTCARCYDGNDYILDIRNGRFRKEIYYTWNNKIEEIEEFDVELRKLKDKFISQFVQVEPE